MLLYSLAPRQIQYGAKPTKEMYRSWMKSRATKAASSQQLEAQARLRVDIEPLDSEKKSSLLWIGDRRKAKKVVFFFHGGGYFVPARKGHLEWCWRAYVAPGLEPGGVETAVAFLEYTLSPVGRFPTQLRQAAAGLSHILASGFRPQDVIIGGDSAGGNLTAVLLCHLIQPMPNVPEVKMAEPLGGAFLVSPWLTRHTKDASFVENDGIDMLFTGTIAETRGYLVGKDLSIVPSVAYPLDAEDLYFERLEEVVGHMYVTAGENEVLRDQGVAYVEKVRRFCSGLDLRFDLQKKMAHDFILLEGEAEKNGRCISDMQEWCRGLLVD